MNTLNEIMEHYDSDKQTAYHGYCKFYEYYFHGLRTQPIALLEMGIQFGNSMRGWLEYFRHPDSRFFGIDSGQTPAIADNRYTFFMCDQRHADTLPLPLLDIVIDDAGHIAEPMQAAFHHLWPKVKPDGFYVLEDVAVFWDSEYHHSGPAGQAWLAQLVSDVNQRGKNYHGKPTPNPNAILTDLEKSIDFVHFMRGLVVIHKRP